MNKAKNWEHLVFHIKRIHDIWYNTPDLSDNPEKLLELHEELSVLFCAAGITETLEVNNPGEITVKEAKKFLEDRKKDIH